MSEPVPKTLRWTLWVMGEPCQSGRAASNDECVQKAWKALRARQDYGSIIALQVEVNVRIDYPAGEHPPPFIDS